jgi:hypothetical protein
MFAGQADRVGVVPDVLIFDFINRTVHVPATEPETTQPQPAVNDVMAAMQGHRPQP